MPFGIGIPKGMVSIYLVEAISLVIQHIRHELFVFKVILFSDKTTDCFYMF